MCRIAISLNRNTRPWQRSSGNPPAYITRLIVSPTSNSARHLCHCRFSRTNGLSSECVPVTSAPTRSYMPNHLQFLFLVSFVLTFLALLALSNLLSSKLRQAGYDISTLILIGLSPSENTYPDQMSSSVAQVVALLLAAATGAFIYLKFSHSGTSSFPTCVRHPLTLPPRFS